MANATSESRWFYARGKERIGPFDFEGLRALATGRDQVKVRLLVHYDGEPTTGNAANLRFLAESLSKDKASVTVLRLAEKPDALVVAFTMPTEAQYKTVDKIDAGLHLWCWDGRDTEISFPKDHPAKARRGRKPSRRRS